MGNCACSNENFRGWPRGAPIRQATFLLLGLDNAGKTTLLANLNKEPTDDVTPTVGFACTRLDIRQFQLTMYDLGGGARIRNIWSNYYAECHGVIFVVDASSVDRLEEAKEALANVVQHEKVEGKPLLVFANKQDKEGAIDEAELRARLGLEQLVVRRRGDERDSETEDDDTATTSVVKCVALRSASGSRSDPAIRQGVCWLLQRVGDSYGELSERVRVDSEAQRAQEQRARAERAERVRRIKEERERLAAEQRAEGGAEGGAQDEGEDEDDEVDTGNPFRPIAQVAREAEEKEKAAKAAKRARKSRQLATTIITVAEPTSDQPTTPGDRRAEGGACLTVGGASLEVQRSEERASGSQLSLGVSSGLSESSDSLTDVTQPSHDHTPSSDSLRLSPAGLSSPTALSQHVQLPKRKGLDGMRVESPPVEKEPKEKKKHRRMLLSRLKNRNKTAPAPEPPAQPTTEAEHRLRSPVGHDSMRPQVSVDTWVTPSPGTESQVRDPLEGLPELPKFTHALPPLKVPRQPPGLGGRKFYVEEDIPASSVSLSQPPLPNMLEPVAT